MEVAQLILQFVIIASIALAGLRYSKLKTYFDEKSKNQATKEDIKIISATQIDKFSIEKLFTTLL